MEIQAHSNGSRAGNEFLALLLQVQADQRREQEAATRWLQERGDIAAEHPDDGWVDRRENSVHLCYPKFRRPAINEGDLIALGSPPEYRLVRVTRKRDNPWALPPDTGKDWRLYFEEVERVTVPRI